jgi:serine/threonine protein kinase
MPPERIRGEAIDFRSDLFSLGVVVYEMAAGENPFEAETPSSTVTRLLDVEPVPLAKARSSEFAPLDRIVAVCLQKQPGRRYESTGRLVAELERLARATATSLEPAREDISAALWWWEFHQVVVSVVYVLALYPAWRAREWLPQPWSLLLLLLASASAAIAATVRLHLWFTARWYPTELTVQRARTRRWTRWSDAGYSVSLLLSALGGASGHPELAMLLLAVSAASAVASFIIEPATTRAAFSRD